MGTGAITAYIDVAQITLYAFWIFFAGLIWYLHREDKREGYPLESDRSPHVRVEGWPSVPRPKRFLLRDGRTVLAPRLREETRPLGGAPLSRHLGAPLEPIGDPMRAAIGPGAYADRADEPDTVIDGGPRILPLRAAPEFRLSTADRDPRGLPVLGADGAVGGVVREMWVDRAEGVFRYLEVETGAEGATRRVLLPLNFSRIQDDAVRVRSILASHFAGVPATRQPDVVTLLEEEKIMAWYGGGTLYATPQRQEPLL